MFFIKIKPSEELYFKPSWNLSHKCYLLSIKIGSNSDGELKKNSNCQQTSVDENHPIALPRHATAPEHGDQDNDDTGENDHGPRHYIDARREEGEELASVNDGPKTNTQSTESEHQ